MGSLTLCEQAYHSQFNDVAAHYTQVRPRLPLLPLEALAEVTSRSASGTLFDTLQIGNMAILPLKTSMRGPAMPPEDPNADDIVSEALTLFRANSLFRNYEIYGAADRVLVYLILFISDCLARIAANKSWTPNDAHKQLQSTAVDNFALPGDPGFPINTMYDPPANRQDAGER